MPKPFKSIPDRWLDYKAIGETIIGTRFISFKVPLKEELNRSLPDNQRFTPQDLISKVQNLGLIIDLTNTTRYYDPKVFQDKSIAYQKIFCEGHKIPKQRVVDNFRETVNTFLENHSTGLIGVHCTHGLNRTGYLVCRYLIESLKMEPENAIKAFEDARGHKIEREIYVQDLKNLPPFQNNYAPGEDSPRNISNGYIEHNGNWDTGDYDLERYSSYREIYSNPSWQGEVPASPQSQWYPSKHFPHRQNPFPAPYCGEKAPPSKAERNGPPYRQKLFPGEAHALEGPEKGFILRGTAAAQQDSYFHGSDPSWKPPHHRGYSTPRSRWEKKGWEDIPSRVPYSRGGSRFRDYPGNQGLSARPDYFKQRYHENSSVRSHPYRPFRANNSESKFRQDRSRPPQPITPVELPKANGFIDLTL